MSKMVHGLIGYGGVVLRQTKIIIKVVRVDQPEIFVRVLLPQLIQHGLRQIDPRDKEKRSCFEYLVKLQSRTQPRSRSVCVFSVTAPRVLYILLCSGPC
jgi:hypothetical protein